MHPQAPLPHLGYMTRRLPGLFAVFFICLPALLAQSAPVANSFLEVGAPISPSVVRIGGEPHLVYELHITNFKSAAVTLTRISVLQDTTPLHQYEGPALAASLAKVGAPAGASDPRTLDGGQRVVFYAWFPLPEHASPAAIRHRISFRVNDGAEQSVTTAAVQVSQRTPVVLGPPLRGGPWVAVYDPGLNNGHRRVVSAIDGEARIPARFAIDWMKLGPDGRLERENASGPANFSYGEDVLAVADGVVASVVDGLPEPTPNISINNEAGNYVVLDLGEGRVAFYEHLKPGSIKVRRGDRVHAGDVLGSVGASGSVFSGAHLHFHVANANSPVAAEGLPFVLRSYQRLGAFPSFAALEHPWMQTPGEKPTIVSDDLPAPLTVLQFQRTSD